MKATLNARREQNDALFYADYENDRCLLQFHSPIELYFVTEGEMEIWVNDHYRLLGAGELAISFSYDTHAYKTPNASRSSVLILPTSYGSAWREAVGERQIATPFLCDRARVAQIRACYDALRQSEGNPLKQQGYVYLILGLVAQGLFFEAEETHSDLPLFRKILLFVGEHATDGITAHDVAAHLGYSQSYLCRYFKAQFHMTLTDYLHAVRLKNAVRLLHEGGRNVTECALECGFCSVRTFYRAFLREFGCAPKEYLQRTNP